MFEYLLITVLLSGVVSGHEFTHTTSYITLPSKERCEELKQIVLDAKLIHLVSISCRRVVRS